MKSTDICLWDIFNTRNFNADAFKFYDTKISFEKSGNLIWLGYF